MYVRPHLDSCDVIYNILEVSCLILLNNLMNSIERIQYQAALAISGTWKGTHLDNFYQQMGYESLTDRRYFRRLANLYKVHDNYTPPVSRNTKSSIKNPFVWWPFRQRSSCISFCRTNLYTSSFYPHSLQACGPELKQAVSLSILKLIISPKGVIFGVPDIKGIKRLFQLPVSVGPLKDHKKRHNSHDTRSDICNCLHESETTGIILFGALHFPTKESY